MDQTINASVLFSKRIMLLFFVSLISFSSVGCKKPSLSKIGDLGKLMSIIGNQKGEIVPKGTILIYGATSSGVVAAVQAAKLAKAVILISPDLRIGGMTSGGLCVGDVYHPQIIGGITGNFYKAVSAHYSENKPSFLLESKVALEEFNKLLKPHSNISIIYNERIDRNGAGVEKDTQNRITKIRMESGKTFTADQFIDASYEGDLMAAAGVSYTIGRESNAQYNETYNGVRPLHPFPVEIDPYVIEGVPTSGLLPRINASIGPVGSEDDNTMAFNYRLTLTKDKSNQVPIPKPDRLNMLDYEIMFRMIKKNFLVYIGWNVSQNGKIDVNSAQYFSTDYVGMSKNYAEATYTVRENLRKDHENYIKGLIWLVQHDPRIPIAYQKFYLEWGLAKDEFQENGNWPTQLYIREGRRMISDFVMTDNIMLYKEKVSDPIGMGSYPLDSHNTQYTVNSKGYLASEGQSFNNTSGPYGISFRSIVPKRKECINLSVSVCISATHSAISSIRMEPQYMIMGQSAAAISALAIHSNASVQDVDYQLLKQLLLLNGQVLTQ